MTRRSPKIARNKASKKTLRKAGRKVRFGGQAYVSMLHRRRMSRKTNTASFVDDIFGEDFHVKRVKSLAGGVLGVLHASMLSIAVIGRAMADLAGIKHKSGVKQIDRLLSNDGLQIDGLERRWVRYVVGGLPELTVAMDWTDFDDDDHTTLCVYLVTRAGRALPLVWKTVKKSDLKDRQTRLETEMLERLVDWVPEGTRLTVLADRGFGKSELYECCALLGIDYVIRFRQDILVSDTDGIQAAAVEYLPANGRPRMLVSPTVTGKKTPVPAVVVTKAKRMQEPWCIATSLASKTAAEVVAKYGRRFTIEEAFRDTKDLHFGMGLSATHIRNADRRDRMLMLVALAQAFLTALGQAGENAGLDKSLKTNTSPKRTLSLLNQGLCWYRALPNMPDDRARTLLAAFESLMTQHEYFGAIFAAI
jgi:hypothetical protein